MSTNHEAVRQMHEDNDTLVALMRAKPVEANFNPPCFECRSAACCSEACFSDMNEVDYILSHMTPAQIEELKPAVLAWRDRMGAMLQHEEGGIGIPYRLANIPCPLLKNGRCSVYEHRPTSCRMFFAHGNAPGCEMPARVNQKFAVLEQCEPFQQIMVRYLLAVKLLEAEHLGLLLYNRLFDKAERSKAAQRIEIVEKEAA